MKLFACLALYLCQTVANITAPPTRTPMAAPPFRASLNRNAKN